MSRSSEPSPTGDRIEKATWSLALLGLIFVAALLRFLAAQKSFWLDELHSTELASSTLSGMFALLRPDFHAPLFFTSAELATKAGLSGHQLRVLPAFGSLLMVWPFLVLMRSSRAASWSILAGAAVLLLSPFQIRYGAELRPYACLGLLSLFATWALFDTRMNDRRRFLLFAAAATLGLYTHYLMAVFIIAAGLARILCPFGGRLPFWKVIAAGTLGVTLFLPWILGVESWLLEDPGVLVRDESQDKELGPAAEQVELEHPGRQFSSHRGDLIALMGRTFAPGAASLGSLGRVLVLSGLGVFVLVFLVGVFQSFKHRERRLGWSIWGPVILALAATSITAVLCVKIWERIPIQYFANSAWSWAFLAVIAVQGFRPGAPRRWAALLLVFVVSLAGLGESLGLPREDLQGAASFARQRAEQESAYLTAILRQPGHYSNIEIYRVYAKGSPALEPQDVPRDDQTVVVLTRGTELESAELPEALVGAIRDGRQALERKDFVGGISVYVFGKRP